MCQGGQLELRLRWVCKDTSYHFTHFPRLSRNSPPSVSIGGFQGTFRSHQGRTARDAALLRLVRVLH